MHGANLSFDTRKSLRVHLGETAGDEIARTLQHLLDRIEELDRKKVNVTPVVRPVFEDEARDPAPILPLRRVA